MQENARFGMVFGAESEPPISAYSDDTEDHVRFDLANLHIQRYGDTAIASYTMLVTTSGWAGPTGSVKVVAHNESRVLVKIDGLWTVVHVHKSPAWPAPHLRP